MLAVVSTIEWIPDFNCETLKSSPLTAPNSRPRKHALEWVAFGGGPTPVYNSNSLVKNILPNLFDGPTLSCTLQRHVEAEHAELDKLGAVRAEQLGRKQSPRPNHLAAVRHLAQQLVRQSLSSSLNPNPHPPVTIRHDCRSDSGRHDEALLLTRKIEIQHYKTD